MMKKVDWASFGFGATLIGAIFTGWQGVEAWKANQKTDERITVSVDRNFWHNSAVLETMLSFGGGPGILRSKWFVEIYNLSSAPVTIKDVGIIGYNHETPLALTQISEEKKGAPEIEPFSIAAGDHKRMEVEVPIPLPISISKIVNACKCMTLDDFREYMKSMGMDELGNFQIFDNRGLPIGFDSQHLPRNAGALIRVVSASGKAYLGFGKWYPGLDQPEFPSKSPMSR
ncbi:hypothetical protein [Azospirillum melinis]